MLWPYSYTLTDVPADMVQDDHDAFVAMGQAMARSNGYTAEQASDLYIFDGSINDWLYGVHRIFTYTFEMYPKSDGPEGFYPADEVIPVQTARNRAAILYLIDIKPFFPSTPRRSRTAPRSSPRPCVCCAAR